MTVPQAARLHLCPLTAVLRPLEPRRCPVDKQRFKQLYALAHGGDMNAKSDLWLEFEFAYDHDPLPTFMNPPSLKGDASC